MSSLAIHWILRRLPLYPWLPRLIAFSLLAALYSRYAFEEPWRRRSFSIDLRLAAVERSVPYHLGLAAPMTVPALWDDFYAGLNVSCILFGIAVTMATRSAPGKGAIPSFEHGVLPLCIPIFLLSRRLADLVLLSRRLADLVLLSLSSGSCVLANNNKHVGFYPVVDGHKDINDYMVVDKHKDINDYMVVDRNMYINMHGQCGPKHRQNRLMPGAL